MDGPVEDIPNGQDDQYLAYSNDDEVESSLQESEGVELSLQEEEEKTSAAEIPEIDDYCKQFVDFMQTQFHRKYDLRSSRKRTRTQEQEEEMPQDRKSVV